jgi:hypothetical protein
MNCVMGNPAFDEIEKDRFEVFHHQHLFDSYREYHGEDLSGVWRDAAASGMVCPQFHAREHLNSILWMKDLREGHAEVRKAFESRFYGLKTKTSSPYQKNYLAAYWAESPQEARVMKGIVSDGLRFFRETFGLNSESFVGCNYVWPQSLEAHLATEGVTQIQTQRGRLQPNPEQAGRASVRRHFTGQQNSQGQRYIVRNVHFEPYLDQERDWARAACVEIGNAFKHGRPAVICTHRVNFSSGMDKVHRDRSLVQLDKLLERVRKDWPDIVFVSSDTLGRMIERN